MVGVLGDSPVAILWGPFPFGGIGVATLAESYSTLA